MTKKEFHSLIQEVHTELLEEEKLKEGLLSWAGGVSDNIVYSILNNYKDIRQTDIFKDPKIRGLAKDLKISQKELPQSIVAIILYRASRKTS